MVLQKDLDNRDQQIVNFQQDLEAMKRDQEKLKLALGESVSKVATENEQLLLQHKSMERQLGEMQRQLTHTKRELVKFTILV